MILQIFLSVPTSFVPGGIVIIWHSADSKQEENKYRNLGILHKT